MWSIETRWFDLAVVMTLLAVGGVLFGKFEQHKPRARRLTKVVVVSALTLILAATLGRAVAYGFLALLLLVALYVHLRWLPAHGINGWTAEPYDRYLALVTGRSMRRRSRA